MALVAGQLLAVFGAVGALGVDPETDDADGDGLTTVMELYYGSDPSNPDSDGGGAGDGWEAHYFLDPALREDDSEDTDYDGLDNYHEYVMGTNPRDRDTDDDELIDSIDPDPLHINGYYDCVHSDCGPGVPPGEDWGTPCPDMETGPGYGPGPGSGPSYPGDWCGGTGIEPEWECTGGQGGCPNFGDEPADADTDRDGLPDVFENMAGTDPLDPDMDGDGLSDGSELNYPGLDPLSKDTDHDGLTDAQETGPLTPADRPERLARGFPSPNTFAAAGLDPTRFTGTDPKRADSDGNGVTDGLDDEDRDHLANVFEVSRSVWIGGRLAANRYWGISDPRNPDTDCDGLLDGDEVDAGRARNGYVSNPTTADTDLDGIEDALDPFPELFTVLPGLSIDNVRVNGVPLNGSATVAAFKQRGFVISGQVFVETLGGATMPIPGSFPVDVFVYLVQFEGDRWVARLVGPPVVTGAGGFASTVRLTNDEIRAGEGFVYLRTAVHNSDAHFTWFADGSWTEPGAPSFAIPSFAQTCATV